MIRESVFNEYGLDKRFLLRGKENTRWEALSDGVFSLAIALLVVSSQVPSTFHELMGFMEDFGAFFLCIVMIIRIWKDHYDFFIKYGLRDAYILKINTILLFLVLFYIYPLKFLFKLSLKQLYIMIARLMNLDVTEQYQELFNKTIQTGDISTLIIIYALGLGGINFCFVLLYRYVLQKKEQLLLSEFELINALDCRFRHSTIVVVTLVSILIGWYAYLVSKPEYNIFAGLVYFSVMVVQKIRKRKSVRNRI